VNWFLFAKKYFMKKGLLFLLLGLSIGFASCKKEGCTNELAINYDKEAEKDDGACELPEIVFDITSPAVGETFGLNSAVNITGSISSNYDLTGYSLKLTNTTKGEVVLETKTETLSKTFNIDETWLNSVSHHSDMLLEITATDETDFEVLRGTSIAFHCHPM